MKTYEVYGHFEVICSMRVKARDKNEAIAKAQRSFGGVENTTELSKYGDTCIRTTKTGSDRSIYPAENPIFDDCGEV